MQKETCKKELFIQKKHRLGQFKASNQFHILVIFNYLCYYQGLILFITTISKLYIYTNIDMFINQLKFEHKLLH